MDHFLIKSAKWLEHQRTCPFVDDTMHDVSEMKEADKQRYRKGDYAWCGRYMVFRAL